MDRFDRIFALHKILAGRRTPVSREELQAKLECSRATVGRLIEEIRDHWGRPSSTTAIKTGTPMIAAKTQSMNFPACGSTPRNCTPCW